MGIVRERFRPVPMGVDGSFEIGGAQMGGFLAKTSGTITVTTKMPLPSAATQVVVDAVPVTEGIYTPIPISFDAPGGVVQLAGGASGTLMV